MPGEVHDAPCVFSYRCGALVAGDDDARADAHVGRERYVQRKRLQAPGEERRDDEWRACRDSKEYDGDAPVSNGEDAADKDRW